MKRFILLILAIASPALAQTADQGKTIYDQHCTACHGADGGAGERAPAIVISSATTLRGERSEAQILDIVRNGIPGTGMLAWKGGFPKPTFLRSALISMRCVVPPLTIRCRVIRRMAARFSGARAIAAPATCLAGAAA